MNFLNINNFLIDKNYNHVCLEDDYKIETGNEFFKPVTDLLKNSSFTFEDYFGKNEDIKFIINKFNKIKNIFYTRIDEKLTNNDVKTINTELFAVDKIIRDMINITSMSIEITKGATISSIPIAAGMMFPEEFNKYDKLSEFDRYEITSSGVKFVHPEGKHMVISIGAVLFANEDMKSEFIVALIFREIGKSFLNYTYGYNFYTQKLFYIFKETVHVTKLIYGIYKDAKSIVETIGKIKSDAEAIKEALDIEGFLDDPESIQILLMIALKNAEIFTIFYNFIKSVKAFKDYIPVMKKWFTRTDEEVEKSLNDKLKDIKNITISDEASKKRYLEKSMELIALLYNRISGFRKLYKKFLNFDFAYNIIENTGADKFPTYYGLGPEYAQAIVEYEKLKDKHDAEKFFFGAEKLFKRIPIFNIAYQLPLLALETFETWRSGNLTTRKKIKRMYRQLEKELNNPNLNPDLKKDIEAEMQYLNEIYDDYIDVDNLVDEECYARAFIYVIFGFAFQIDNSFKLNNDNILVLLLNTLKNNYFIQKYILDKDKEFNIVINKIVSNNSFESTTIDTSHTLPSPKVINENKQFFNGINLYKLEVQNEDYFGKTEIVLKSEKYIHELRKIFHNDEVKKDSNEKAKKRKLTNDEVSKVKDILVDWGEDIALEFNVEKCVIELENVYNAYCMPLSVGSWKEAKNANSKIIEETPTGYKFKNGKGIFYLLCIGIPIIRDTEMRDIDIVSVLFHELGHCMQQHEVDTIIKLRSTCIYASFVELIESLALSVVTINPILLFSAIYEILSFPFNLGGVRVKRDVYAKEMKINTETILKKTKVKKIAADNSIKKPVDNFIYIIMDFLSSVIKYVPLPGISSLLMVFLNHPLGLIDFMIRGFYFKQVRNCEYFADSFAAKYGLGNELSIFLNKFNRDRYIDKRVPAPIQYIGQFNQYFTMRMIKSLLTHPMEGERIDIIRETIEKELNSTNKIPESLKKQMRKDMDEIDKQFELISNPNKLSENGMVGLGFAIYISKLFVKSKSKLSEAISNKSEFVNDAIETLKSNSFMDKILNVNEAENEILETESD